MAKDCGQRRAELLQTFSVPTLEDAAESLGPVLSAVVLNTMSQKAQLLIGVQRPLSIVPDNMWIAPQTRLDGGRIVQTVPDRLECLQAFTHQKILEVGALIEQKWHEDKEAAIEQAKRDTELFEKFECAQRIKFSVKTEHLKQTRKRELERDQLMAAFQVERDQMTKSHKSAIESNAALLRRELQLDFDRRLREEVGRMENEGAENECRWQLEVAILKTFIADAQQRQDSAVSQTKTDYLRIFKKLFVGFELELESQRDTMQCKHMAELLHAICIEKELAFNELAAMNTDSSQMDTTTTDSPETPLTSQDSPAPTRVCPNVLKFRRLFANMLEQYKEFVEWSLGKAHCQGAFLVPLEKHLKSLMLEQHHTDNVHFDCCGGQCVNAIEQEGISFIRACTTDMQAEPIYTAVCRVQSEPIVAVEESDVVLTSSSLSCFHLDGTMYASNQHYLEIVNRLYPTEDLSIDWKAADEATEHDESRLYSENLLEHIQSHINAATIQIEHELRTVKYNEAIRSDILQCRLKRLVNQVLSTNYPRNDDMSPRQNNHQVDHSDLKMLSVVDSVELMHSHQLNQNHCTDIYVNPRTECGSQSVPLRCTIETQTECPFVGHVEDPTTCVPAQVISNRGTCLMLSNDEYMRSRRKSPVYMQSGRSKRSETIWNRYRVTTDTEWRELLARVDAGMPDKRVRVADKWSLDSAGDSNDVEPPVQAKKRSILRNAKPPDQMDVFDSFLTSNGGCLTTERLFKRMEEDAEIVQLMNKSNLK